MRKGKEKGKSDESMQVRFAAVLTIYTSVSIIEN